MIQVCLVSVKSDFMPVSFQYGEMVPLLLQSSMGSSAIKLQLIYYYCYLSCEWLRNQEANGGNGQQNSGDNAISCQPSSSLNGGLYLLPLKLIVHHISSWLFCAAWPGCWKQKANKLRKNNEICGCDFLCSKIRILKAGLWFPQQLQIVIQCEYI